MNHPINIAILGLGMIARNMAQAISLVDDYIPYAVAARDPLRAESFAKEFGFKKAYGSYEEMLYDDDIDVVYIATPHALHSQHALMCLQAGKNIIVEKPFAANALQAQEVFDMALEKKLFCAEAMWMRYVPVAQKIQEAIASGVIGDVGVLTGEIGYHLVQERLFDPNMAGGALLDVGVYGCALSNIVFKSKLLNVTADAQFTNRGVDETNGFILHYEGGKLAVLTSSMKYTTSSKGTIWGTDGYIDISNINCLVSATVCKRDKSIITQYTNSGVDNYYIYELKSFAQCLHEGKIFPPECPYYETIERMKMLDGIRKGIGLVYPFEQ